MTESSETKGPAPMEGHGAYNRSSLVQAAGSSPAVPLLEKAAQQVSLPAAPEPVVIVDYGSSRGREPLLPLVGGLWDSSGPCAPHGPIFGSSTPFSGNEFHRPF